MHTYCCEGEEVILNRFRILVVVILLGGSPYSNAGPGCSADPPAPWLESEDSAWQGLPGPLGGWLADPALDLSNFWDGVGAGGGSLEESAGYWALSGDESTVFFRVRLADNPAKLSGGGGWESFGFHTLIESDGDTTDSSWDHWVKLSGISEEVDIEANSTPDPAWCDDAAEATSYCYPAPHIYDFMTATSDFPGFARVTPACSSGGSQSACDSSACMADLDFNNIWDGGGGCTDVFLEIQVPAADLAAATGLGDLDFLYTPVVLGTSANGTTVNKDVLGGACTDTWDYMAAGSRDLDGDGIIDGDEGLLGTDSNDPDSDDDSLSDGVEVYGPDLIPDTGDEVFSDPLDPDTDGDGICDAERQDSYTGPWWMDPRPLEGDKDGGSDILDPSDDCTGSEATAGTDPLDLDSDDDSLSDGAEDLAGSDPLDPDTDDDGICDGPRADNDGDGLFADPDNPPELDPCLGDEAAAGTDPLDPDSDDDGLLDGEEDQDGDGVLGAGETAPYDPDTDDDLLCDDARADNDDDGIDPADPCGGSEVAAGTDPRDPDTDGGGINDGTEVLQDGTNPVDNPLDDILDTDGDGLYDYYELTVAGTDPLDADSDDDSLIDGAEDSGGSDPLDPDTDDDGICDGPRSDNDGDGLFADPDNPPGLDPCSGDEAAAGTDPLDPDSDDDGLLDGEEDQDGDGVLGAGETDPLDADTDDDSLSDGAEDSGVTDPLDPDTDEDGLCDDSRFDNDGDGLFPDPDNPPDVDPCLGSERAAGTDPVDPDSDDDGWTDLEEILAGSNPNDPDSTPDNTIIFEGFEDRVIE